MRYALVGGYAVSLHGAVRGTLDIDVVIDWSKESFDKAQQALNAIGLTSRLPLNPAEVFSFREEYIANRNLFAWGFVNKNNPSEIVDIVLTENLKKMKTKKVTVQGQRIEIVSKTDLIRIKSKAGREQDKLDVIALNKL